MLESVTKQGSIEIPKEEIVRDFIYIDDVISAVEKSLKYKQSIKNLIMAIKTSLSESSQSNSGGVGEQ